MNGFEPGIYEVPELDYHNGKFGPADSLSSTEAKRILQAPKVLQWTRDHPQETPIFTTAPIFEAEE